MSKSIHRIFKDLKPDTYHIVLKPDFKKLTFTGEVEIRLRKTSRPSLRLTIHQDGLKITAARIKRLDKRGVHEYNVVRINHHNSLQEVRLHTDQLLYGGDYTVHMIFNGRITDSMTGLYPCYFTYEGTKHMLLATQLESHFARQVFPCIDEPSAKAKFTVKLIVPKDLVAISNMPRQSTKLLTDGTIETTFEETPKMTPYLLAFVIGELHSKTKVTADGKPVTVWATISQPIETVDFALATAVKAVEFFENYFDVPYPLPKIDHVALPDFGAGAMENWGLVTYRDRVLLALPDETSQDTLERIAVVITHETAHQWFGNLVTMNWWDDLWLNESFANLMQYCAVNALYPAWNIWDEFISYEGVLALRRDASPNVQAIHIEVHHPQEINAIFDPAIVYAKGGRLLYMLKEYIGETMFRDGLKNYFKRHAYGSTSGDDLWQALSDGVESDVKSLMRAWIDRPGFPELIVDQNEKKLCLYQKRFYDNGQNVDDDIWPIPLFARRDDLPPLFFRKEQHMQLKQNVPVQLNIGAAGHYIVNYKNSSHRAFLRQKVADGDMSVIDRLMLLNEASMIAKAGDGNYADVLKLLQAYSEESSEPVWSIIGTIIADVRQFIDLDARLEQKVKQFIRQLIEQEYSRLGWEVTTGEPSNDRKLRVTILALGIYADDTDISEHAVSEYKAFASKHIKLNADLRAIIFAAAINHQVKGSFEFLRNLYIDTNSSELKDDIAAALTLTKNADQTAILLNSLTDVEVVKPQDVYRWFAYMIRNRHMRHQSWDWLTSHWAWLDKTFAHDLLLQYFPRYASNAITTIKYQEKYNKFFAPMLLDPRLKRAVTIGNSDIAARVAWLNRDIQAIQNFFGLQPQTDR